MLWTDRDFVAPDDLRALDPEAPTIAQFAKVELTGPAGLLHHSIEDSRIELQSLMQSAGLAVGPTEIPFAHLYALLGPVDGQMVRLQPGQIVVSDIRPNSWSPLKRWVVAHALMKLYATAADRATGDRYKTKWERMEMEIERRHQPMMINTGIPVVRMPIPCPAAAGEPDTGSWTAANLSAAAGNGTYTGDVRVALSYVAADYKAPDARNNGESGLSDEAVVTIDGGGIAIDIASLRPAAAQSMASRHLGFYTVRAVTGWNVWAGQGTDALTLQNASPIPIATTTWSCASLQLPGIWTQHTGQYPDLAMSVQRLLMRG